MDCGEMKNGDLLRWRCGRQEGCWCNLSHEVLMMMMVMMTTGVGVYGEGNGREGDLGMQ